MIYSAPPVHSKLGKVLFSLNNCQQLQVSVLHCRLDPAFPCRGRDGAKSHHSSLAGFLISPEIPTSEFLLSHPQIPKATDSQTYTILDLRGGLEIIQVNFLTFEMSSLSIFPKVTQLEVFLLPGFPILPVREPCNRSCSSCLVLF